MAEAGRWQAEEMPRLPEAATCEEQLNLNMDSYSPQPVEQDMVSLPEAASCNGGTEPRT